MEVGAWVKSFPGAVTLADAEGIIVAMNDTAAEMFVKSGGRELIGKSLLDCHPEPSLSKLKEVMESKQVNCYTVEREGIKKMVYQGPWHADGQYMGIMEMVFGLPADMPHYVRD
ncbi:MAG: PAS domain-containing protein [Candidatus Saccharibacteria bacterium]